MSQHPNPEQRIRVEKEILEDLEKPIEQLLADIHDESVNASPDYSPLTRTLARFASLLAVLSEKAEQQTKRIVCLTWGLFLLTLVLALLTGYLCYDSYTDNLNSNQTDQSTSQKTEPDK